MKFISLSLLMMISVNAFADLVCEEDPNNGGGGTAAEIVKFVEGQECPNKAKLKNLCLAVGNQMKDLTTSNSPYEFLYQRKFNEAGCVKSTDSADVRDKKIKAAWEKFENEKEFHCTNQHFDVDQGNILKYAVAKNFEEFLDDAIKWKVNLNKTDSDKQTVLDYIQQNINKNKGNDLESIYKLYYLKLKKAGAKHSNEI